MENTLQETSLKTEDREAINKAIRILILLKIRNEARGNKETVECLCDTIKGLKNVLEVQS